MLIRPIQGRHSLVLFGPNGGGKGLLAKIAGSYGYNHIESGQLLRDAGTFQEILVRGSLAASEVTHSLVCQKVTEFGEGKKFTFDGYPRTVEQCEKLFSYLRKIGHEFPVVHVVTALALARDRALNGEGRGNRGDEAAIDDRHRIYRENIGPMCDYCHKVGVRFYLIDNNGSPDRTARQFEHVLLAEGNLLSKRFPMEVGKPLPNTIMV